MIIHQRGKGLGCRRGRDEDSGQEATRHFGALPQALRDPVPDALTDLEIDPELTGKPLLGRLKGLWSATVGSYRIIYSIEESGARRT